MAKSKKGTGKDLGADDVAEIIMSTLGHARDAGLVVSALDWSTPQPDGTSTDGVIVFVQGLRVDGETIVAREPAG